MLRFLGLGSCRAARVRCTVSNVRQFLRGEVAEYRLGREEGNEWVLAEVTSSLRSTSPQYPGFYEIALLEDWEVRDLDKWDGLPYRAKFFAGQGFSASEEQLRAIPELEQERLL